MYIAHSRSKPLNALNTLVMQKQKCLQWLSVTVHRTLRILHVFGQWVPDRRTSNRESPTAVRAEPVGWNGDLMTAGRMQTLGEVQWFQVLLGSLHSLSLGASQLSLQFSKGKLLKFVHLCLHVYCMSVSVYTLCPRKKTSHFNFRHNFVICWDICAIFEAFCSGIIHAWQSISHIRKGLFVW